MGPTWAICSFAASRAKLTMLNTVSKIRGQVKNPGYPQSEGLLGECMVRHGKELGGESNFGEGQLRGRGGRAAMSSILGCPGTCATQEWGTLPVTASPPCR